MLPAALLWLFVAVCVFPKFNEVPSDSRVWMPGIYRAAGASGFGSRITCFQFVARSRC